MFEQLFGSRTRVKLMKLFLNNQDRKFFVREITRLSETLINSVRRELENLVSIGLIQIVSDIIPEDDEQVNSSAPVAKTQFDNRKYYILNKNHLFRRELENLFAKEQILIEKNFTDKILAVGNVAYLALSGFFINDKRAKTDLIAVGNFDKEKIQRVIKQFEKNINRGINYTLMDLREYKLRKDIADRFLNDIIMNEQNLVVLNKINKIGDL
jgi:hypothetical protein